jgi:hypothetical protein
MKDQILKTADDREEIPQAELWSDDDEHTEAEEQE